MWEGDPVRVDQKKPLVGFALVAALCAVLMGVSMGKGYGLGDVFHVGRPITGPAAAAAEAPRPAVQQAPMKVIIPAELSTPTLGSGGSAETSAPHQEADGTEVLSAAMTGSDQDRTSAAPESAGATTDRDGAREQRKADREAAREQRKTERAAVREERKAERAAAREERKAERAAARDARKAQRATARASRPGRGNPGHSKPGHNR